MSTWLLSSVKTPHVHLVEQNSSRKRPHTPMEHARFKAARTRQELYVSSASVQDLPTEMLDIILKNLDHDSKRNARLVCKQWKELVDKTVTFHAVLCEDTVKHVANCKHELKELTVVNLACRRNLPRPVVKIVTLGTGISAFTIGRMLRHKPLHVHLKSLTFDHNSLSDVEFDGRFLAKLSLPTLAELRLIVVPFFIKAFQQTRYNHLSGLDEVLSYIVTPSLKTLVGEFNATCNLNQGGYLDFITVHMMETLLATFARFAVAQAASLTKVKLEFMAESAFRDNVKLPDLSSLKLNVLQLRMGSKHFHTLLRFPASVQQLQHLELTRTFLHFPADGQEFENIIWRHSSSLQHLKIGLVVFKARWIAQCKNLKTLDLKVLSSQRQRFQFDPICISSLEELNLDYSHEEGAGPTNSLLSWIRESFPNLKKLVLEFKLRSFMSIYSILLLLDMHKLESIVLIQPRTPPEDPAWDFHALCAEVPELTLIRTMNLNQKRVFYELSIERETKH